MNFGWDARPAGAGTDSRSPVLSPGAVSPPNSPSPSAIQQLAAAHARFARAALGIYFAIASVAVVLLVALLATEFAHTRDQTREHLLVGVHEREHQLSHSLALLAQELRRLGMRSEIDLLDQNLGPEKSLLQLSHQRSTFFNLGVAIVGVDGSVLWAEPPTFLRPETSFANEPWFDGVRSGRTLRIVPVDPARADEAALYVVAPVVRNRQFDGALLGAIDLAHDHELGVAEASDKLVHTILATRQGEVVYPATPPTFRADPAWKAWFEGRTIQPEVSTLKLASGTAVIAASPVTGTDLVLMRMVDQDALYEPERQRLELRLALVFGLASLPVLALVFLLRRSLRVFRASEERALREERLRLVGEAANLIAHEVKNTLNGIKMAAEIAFEEPKPGDTKRRRAMGELRGEISRLSEFATELMTFSKGVAPRRTLVDLNELVAKVTALSEKAATDAGVALDVSLPPAPVRASADPQLLHVVLANLLTNALEAVTGTALERRPLVRVRLGLDEGCARLEVSDNGPGVDQGVRAHLFEPFHSGKANGVGIGLALSRRIAVAHGGDLVLGTSRPGASFILTLPRSAA